MRCREADRDPRVRGHLFQPCPLNARSHRQIKAQLRYLRLHAPGRCQHHRQQQLYLLPPAAWQQQHGALSVLQSEILPGRRRVHG